MDINLTEEEMITVELQDEEQIEVEIMDTYYIPGFVEAEEQRRSNEETRISNEEARQTYYEDIQNRVNSGEFNGKDGTMSFEELTGEQKESLRGPQGPQGIQGPQGEKGKDAETPKAINEQTGSSLSVSASNYNALKFKIDGKTEQEIRSGKNKFGFGDYGEKTNNGIKHSATNSVITLNGANTSSNATTLINSYEVDLSATKDEVYTLSYTIVNGTKNVKLGVSFRDASGTQLDWLQDANATDLSVSKTISANTLNNTKTIWFFVRTKEELSNLQLKIQIEKGSATEYEQYGVSPSSDYPSEIKSVGYGNLLNINVDGVTIRGVEITKNEDNSFTFNGHTTEGFGYNLTTENITYESGKKYTIIAEVLSGSCTNYNSTMNWAFLFCADNSNSHRLSIGSNTTKISLTFTGDGTNFIPNLWFGFNASTTANDAVFNNFRVRFQIEEGSIEHDFVPYGSYTKVKITNEDSTKEVLIDLQDNELCSIGDVKDTLNIVNSKAILTKNIGKVVLNGSENWERHTTSTSGAYRFLVKNINAIGQSANENKEILCDIVKNVSRDDIWSNAQGITYLDISDKGIAIYLEDTKSMTLDQFKTWLNGNNVTVYYELATPETIDLGTIDIPLSNGTNNITLVDDLETELYIKYYTEFKGEKGEGSGGSIDLSNYYTKEESDSLYINTTSNQEIGGYKNFTNFPTCSGTPTSDMQLVNGAYVKRQIEEIDLNSANKYSTEEQVVGTWINGKPLYRKTYVASVPSSTSGTQTVDINLSSISNIEMIYVNTGASFLLYSGGSSHHLGYYDSSNVRMNNYFKNFPNGIGDYRIDFTGLNAGTMYITFEYTKTTD